MFHNKETPTREVKTFHSKAMNPEVEQKRIEKHTPQKLVIRAKYDSADSTATDFIGQTGGYVNLKFEVAAKLLQNLPDVCHVACEQFVFSEQFNSTQVAPLYLNESLNTVDNSGWP
jgi:tRNA A37 threonylcarbamoyladenosine modification protein TsaB